MACWDSVVEEVGHKVLEIFRGDTCNGCLAQWKNGQKRLGICQKHSVKCAGKS